MLTLCQVQRLERDPSILLLWAGATASTFGNAVSEIAIPTSAMTVAFDSLSYSSLAAGDLGIMLKQVILKYFSNAQVRTIHRGRPGRPAF